MMKAMLPAVVLALAFHAHAFADDQDSTSKSSTRIEDVKPASEKNKPSSGEDADDIITNKKMRAESGSKSKWSIGSTLSYSGGTIETPLNEKRPDLTGGQGQTLFASAGGSVGVGYKPTTSDRFSLDVGVRWITPFQANAPKTYHGDRVDASNPSVTYSKIGRVGSLQSQFSIGPTVITATDMRKWGYQYAGSVAENLNYEIGKSGLSIGIYANADYYTFDKNDLASKAVSSDFDYGIVPYAEYVLNDTFNLRTVFNWAIYEHDRNRPTWTITKLTNQQSVGLGISVTRDIFLYPNLQFQPLDLTHVFRADTTNVALTANINIF